MHGKTAGAHGPHIACGLLPTCGSLTALRGGRLGSRSLILCGLLACGIGLRMRRLALRASTLCGLSLLIRRRRLRL